MLNIKTVQSTNQCVIEGILNELNIEEKTGSDGTQYVMGTAKIRVDTVVDGEPVENIIPIFMYSKRLKNNGELNKVYDMIVGYKNNFTSAAVVEDISKASRVICAGKNCNIVENMWVPNGKNTVTSTFRIATNFINHSRSEDSNSEDKATFELSGVILGIKPELNKNEEETGRIIVDMGVVGYQGRIDVIPLIAEGTKKAHVESNWEKGDTVTVVGVINMSSTVQEWKEELGFGEPITRQRTISKRELLIMGGSSCGNEEALSYDSGDVKVALAERKKRQEMLIEKASNSSAANKTKSNTDFGF